MFKRNWNHCTNLKDFPEINNKDKQTFNLDEKPIEVSSCFGGLAIYNMKYLLDYDCKYRGNCIPNGPCGINGKEECEHVPFNNCIVSNGAIIAIYPNLLNGKLDSEIDPPIISSRGILNNTFIYSWNSSYKNYSTEYRVNTNFFKKIGILMLQ